MLQTTIQDFRNATLSDSESETEAWRLGRTTTVNELYNLDSILEKGLDTCFLLLVKSVARLLKEPRFNI
jgi:hypothetical protein